MLRVPRAIAAPVLLSSVLGLLAPIASPTGPVLPSGTRAAVGRLHAQQPADAHQADDARLPRQGEVWLEVAPSLLNWDEQFALDSPVEGIADGDREPLFADFDGPVLGRVFPELAPALAAGVNADAEPLGFDPLAPEDVSVGGLDFATMQAQVRRVDIGLRIGVFDFLSLEGSLPLVHTELEPRFALDTASATIGLAGSALLGGDVFLDEFGTARSDLQAIIEAGGLSPEEEAAAMELLALSGPFLAALERRVMDGLYLPLAGSAAGMQMTARYAGLVDGFEDFGLLLPTFPLQEVVPAADLVAFFGADPLAGTVPGISERSWTVGEIEAGIRIGLIDNFSDSTAVVRVRTSLGGRVRLPLETSGVPPFEDPADFLDIPRGDGQRDLEAAFYQDLRVGSAFALNLAGRYGIQREDELVLRVHPPDRPFALESTQTTVARDLGDYVHVRAAPRVLLASNLSVGADYSYWHKQADVYRLVGEPEGLEDAAPLELETEQTRQRIGLGAFYRSADPAGRDAGTPWRIGLVIQWAIAGSGGQTPASQLVLVDIRAPFGLFR